MSLVSKLFSYVKENNICLILLLDTMLIGLQNDVVFLFQYIIFKSLLFSLSIY